MRVVGLVTEYNPFHNGHLYHLEASKKQTKADHTVAVMSGHFLQRGEPALLDKWSRAKAAVESGVDLVIEIPTLYACSSAEYFAFGSVYILDALGIVDSLCFGSEDGRLDSINTIADALLNPTQAFTDKLQSALKSGVSYPRARSMALESDFDFKANNILGIEYLKALKILESSIIPDTIKRIDAAYLDENLSGTIASATAIRKHASDLEAVRGFIPDATYKIMKNHHIFKEDMIQMLLYKIRTTSAHDLSLISDVSEGLENKIKKVAEQVESYDQLLEGIVSKRFTKTRVQRILVKILLDIKKSDFDNQVPRYARILAFNHKGKDILNAIKKTSKIPLISNINKVSLDDQAIEMLALDIKATNIYKLMSDDKIGGDDYLNKPIYIKR